MEPQELSPDIDHQLAISYGTFLQLSWTPDYAGPVRLLGHTPRRRFYAGFEILAEAGNSSPKWSSRLNLTDAGWNKRKKDKANQAQAAATYQQLATIATPLQVQEWKTAIESLRARTTEVLEEERIGQEAVEQVMHTESGSRKVTYSLMILNLTVYIAMVIGGASLFEPGGETLIRWGANYGPATTGGEWWRLFTCMFVHIGLLHLGLNLYALYLIGNYLEPLIGSRSFVLTYVASGILASLTSLWWHDLDILSAGASGAIFGAFGVFLALLTTPLIPASARKGLLISMGIYVGYSLVYGLKDGIDNSAHMGGLVSGGVMGYLLYASIRKPGLKLPVQGFIVATAILISGLFLLRHQNDTPRFEKTLVQFYRLQDSAMAAYDRAKDNDSLLLTHLERKTLPAWKAAAETIQGMNSLQLSSKQEQHRDRLKRYADLRIQETTLILQILTKEDQKEAALDSVKASISRTVDSLNKSE